MKKEEILEILIDWNFWKKDQDTGKGREYWIKELNNVSNINEIAAITGVRRCGKSTILLQFCKELIKKGVNAKDILIVNLEDPRFRNLSLELLNEIYEVYVQELIPAKKHYVILDEVQSVKGWEKFVRFLHENKKAAVFVTGSNSKLLSSDYSSIITGRHVDILAYPLSFKEYLTFKNVNVNVNDKLEIISDRHEINRLYKEYLKFGGFPKVSFLSEDEKSKLLKTYFSDIIIKDIIMKHKLSEREVLEELAKYYISNTSSMHSFNKLKNVFGVSLDTIQRFSGYLASTYLLFFVKKFSHKVKEQVLNPRKVYCIDTGLINAVSFKFSENIGKVMENLVAVELLRRSKEIYYWRDYSGKEVDFVIKEGLEVKQLIQVCYGVEEYNTKERELRSLIKASGELKCKNLLVITEDYEGEEEFKGIEIKFLPIWKWLLY